MDYGNQRRARILGQIDTSKLVDIDPMTNQGPANRKSREAMLAFLSTTEMDFYLLATTRGREARTTRYRYVPFDTAGVGISSTRQPDGNVYVWLSEDRDVMRTATDGDFNSYYTLPISGIIPAILFRKLYGDGPREFDLGPELGLVSFTPTAFEFERDNNNAGTYRFPYSDPGASSYSAGTQYDPMFRAWMWLTDPITGHPGDQWWKVSYVIDNLNDDPSLRVDDPSEPPPFTPPFLHIA